jgi:ketosteroid isomerase-like protein
MLKAIRVLTMCSLLFASGTVFSEELVKKDSRTTVEETERAFAETMAQRDFEKFKTFISEEAVFFSGTTPLRGRQQIADAWEGFFKDPAAPFSWEPENVEVLDSGTLAWSTGPVYDTAGKQVATFNSVWQLDASKQWRIIFDKGNDVCNCP